MIKGPSRSTPTTRGWICDRTGELLKSQRITPDQISEWHGMPAVGQVQTLHEAPYQEIAIAKDDLTHYELKEQEEEAPKLGLLDTFFGKLSK
tara:strand:+ start:1459 stop:1734 length:276 start_codon:yes stop_codon:yes gene_type:complete